MQRVFISHNSSNMTPAETAIYNAVLSMLQRVGFPRDGTAGSRGQLLIDENNAPGEPWRRRVNEWLHEAEHGIIFCTRESNTRVRVVNMRDWLLTEAVVLSHRHQVGDLPGVLLVICCNIAFKSHFFFRLDSLHLREIQVLEINSDSDLPKIRKAVEALVLACGRGSRAGAAPANKPGTQPSELHTDITRLAQWLERFQRSVVAYDTVRRAMRALGVLPAGSRTPPAHVHHTALALHLVRGPTMVPNGFTPQPPYHRPYSAELLAQWSELMRWNGIKPVKPAAEDLVDKLATTWAGLRLATLIGHQIKQCRKAKVFHIRFLLSPQGAEQEPAPEELAELLREFRAKHRKPHKLLESLLAAAGWVWLGDDPTPPSARHVADQCRYIRNRQRSRETILQIPSTVFSREGLLKLVTRRLEPDEAALENPLIIVDDRQFFCDGEDPDPDKIGQFLDDCNRLTQRREDWAYPRIFLFIVSHGQPPADSWRPEWPRYQIPVEIWRAAWQLEKVRQNIHAQAS